jgi:hypothetical protein
LICFIGILTDFGAEYGIKFEYPELICIDSNGVIFVLDSDKIFVLFPSNETKYKKVIFYHLYNLFICILSVSTYLNR